MSPRAPALGLLALLVVLGADPPARAARTSVRETAADELRRGESVAVAVTSRGALFPAPRLIRLGEGRPPGEPSHVWSIAADAAGDLYLGTGPGGQIVKVTSDGRQTVFHAVDEPLVTALAFDRNGDLLAGTSPGGKIFRIGRDGTGSTWSETGERYVWSLAVASDGAVYAGTGERGAVLRIRADGRAEPFFDGIEPHIVSLVATPDGGLLAGGAGHGLLYGIDGEGNGLVLHEDELPEVSALALARDGSVLAALVAPPPPETEAPALRLRLPDGVSVGRTDENVGRLEESAGPLLQGTIEGLPERAAPGAFATRGRVVRVSPAGRTTELWRSSSEAPLSLVADGDGVVFGTGEPARLYRVAGDGEVALLHSLPQAQVTGLLAGARSILVATSNPAAAYRLDPAGADTGAFLSSAIDAGGPARWGAVRWQVAGPAGGGRVELYTRTGNSRVPDGTWSGWSPALTDPGRSRVTNPDGRYLQWRARFVDPRPGSPRLSGVSVHVEPYNRPPEIRDFRSGERGSAVAAEAGFLWSVRDADGDPLETEIEARARDGGEWIEVAVARAPDAAEAPGAAQGWREERVAWDVSAAAEGDYDVRATVSDRAANEAEAARSVVADGVLRLVVDRTPPRHDLRSAGGGRFELTLEDQHSEIRRLEVLEGGRVIATVRPQDGLCDSRRESFVVVRPAGASASWTLRGFDAAGNTVEIPLDR